VIETILKTDNLLCLWDFENGSRTSKGKHSYTLLPGGGLGGEIVTEGVLSGRALRQREGEYLSIPRADCPALNISGREAQVTVLAWIKRTKKSVMPDECEAVAGMWLETEGKRQYCLFLNLWIHDSSNQVCGHVSGIGGPTEGEKWCMDASINKKPVPFDEWCMVGFSYDGQYATSFLNGEADPRAGRNPYHYPLGIFDGGVSGADFTVGAVHRLGNIGNFFAGIIGGIAVYDRALNDVEVRNIYTGTTNSN
jgi:hypothetical protein